MFLELTMVEVLGLPLKAFSKQFFFLSYSSSLVGRARGILVPQVWQSSESPSLTLDDQGVPPNELSFQGDSLAITFHYILACYLYTKYKVVVVAAANTKCLIYTGGTVLSALCKLGNFLTLCGRTYSHFTHGGI